MVVSGFKLQNEHKGESYMTNPCSEHWLPLVTTN